MFRGNRVFRPVLVHLEGNSLDPRQQLSALEKIRMTRVRHLISFSKSALRVNYLIVVLRVVAMRTCSGPLWSLMVLSGGSLLDELDNGRRLRMGYGREPRGASLFTASVPHFMCGAAKEM
jgi:hypothetical protein